MQGHGEHAQIGFIGGGNMARAMIGGLIAAGHPASEIRVAEPDAAQRASLNSQWPDLETTTDNKDLAAWSALCVLAVKPQVMPDVAQALDGLDTDPLYLSIAAGVRSADLSRWLGGGRVVRAMPNQGALVGHSATGLYSNAALDGLERATIDALVATIGTAYWVANEADIDAVTAIAGSGPAYFFLLMEYLEQAGEDFGLDPSAVRHMVAETAVAAALLAVESDEPVATLRARVTSPGGTTAAALDHLAKHDTAALFAAAFEQARNRARELADRTP
ncbi:MAG: pyrroline-5-carboxylate reductase [Pseudomonadota bacterium]